MYGAHMRRIERDKGGNGKRRGDGGFSAEEYTTLWIWNKFVPYGVSDIGNDGQKYSTPIYLHREEKTLLTCHQGMAIPINRVERLGATDGKQGCRRRSPAAQLQARGPTLSRISPACTSCACNTDRVCSSSSLIALNTVA